MGPKKLLVGCEELVKNELSLMLNEKSDKPKLVATNP
jgi:hypothetical protein